MPLGMHFLLPIDMNAISQLGPFYQEMNLDQVVFVLVSQQCHFRHIFPKCQEGNRRHHGWELRLDRKDFHQSKVEELKQVFLLEGGLWTIRIMTVGRTVRSSMARIFRIISWQACLLSAHQQDRNCKIPRRVWGDADWDNIKSNFYPFSYQPQPKK